nr:MAG TPA: peptidase [Caudoviricetes sp.]
MKYFTIAELVRSKTADRLGIDNRCKTEHVTNLTLLVNNVLDPLREAYGKPITINSGFRCPALNSRIGGAATSDHLKGMAADITAGSPAENRRLFNLIQELKLPFKQLIDEKHFSWVHVSYDKNDLKRQILAL